MNKQKYRLAFILQHLFFIRNLRGIEILSRKLRFEDGRVKIVSGDAPFLLSQRSMLLIVFNLLSSFSKSNVPPLRTVLLESKLIFSPSFINFTKLVCFSSSSIYLLLAPMSELDFVDLVILPALFPNYKLSCQSAFGVLMSFLSVSILQSRSVQSWSSYFSVSNWSSLSSFSGFYMFY